MNDTPPCATWWGVLLELFFQTFFIQEKIVNIHGENTVFIVISWDDVFGNNNFFEGVVNFLALHGFRLENKIITKTRACLIL